MSSGWMSPGLARHSAPPGTQASLERATCTAAIADRLSRTLTVTVMIGGFRIAFARPMTR